MRCVANFARRLVPQFFNNLIYHSYFVYREELQDWFASCDSAMLFVSRSEITLDEFYYPFLL